MSRPSPACCFVPRHDGDAAVTAALYALAVDRRNAGVTLHDAAWAPGVVLRPLAAVACVGKLWHVGATLGVEFLDEDTPAATRRHVLRHANAWSEFADVRFLETRRGEGIVRVSFDRPGYWSVLGTDALACPAGEPTLNLEGFDGDMPESEWRRVVRHEFGHVLGLDHEQQRPEELARLDPEKVVAEFMATQGWSRAEVVRQVLAPLDMRAMVATDPDERSIMMYAIAGRLTRDGVPIPGGVDITAQDAALAARLYPYPAKVA